ncbi:MalY/PatB family protein [uncultured Ilyobacter sp.]|uniref:MalY/PatB family protein n=1 Tax=uncultured Ilyobacter sp. TaxID=544433 RepID=UPI0029F56769|nr:MalY/PatB family protein [uncultured Ilyobacter sp.]
MKYNFDRGFNHEIKDSLKWNTVKRISNKKDIIPMWIADMDFETVPEVKTAIIERATQGIYGYSEMKNEYYESLAGWTKKRYNWEIEKEWLCFSPGVVTGISLTIRALTHPGDKVVIQTPVYSPFFGAVTRSGCELVTSSLKLVNGKYKMDFEDLEEKLKDKRTKIMVLCNPHNPVGRAWTRDELIRLGEICLKNNVTVISDEIHSDLVYKGHKYTPFASISKEFEQNSIICTAPSKTFNLAGLQSSNIIIPNENFRREYKIALENIEVSRLNVFGMVACETAYTHGEPWLEELLDYLEANKELVKKRIENKIPKLKLIEPEATYLLWIDCSGLGLSDEKLKKFMIEKAGILLNDGISFGEEGKGFQRMNIACPKEILEEALNRLEKAVNSI